jgi:hypothetical protein
MPLSGAAAKDSCFLRQNAENFRPAWKASVQFTSRGRAEISISHSCLLLSISRKIGLGGASFGRQISFDLSHFARDAPKVNRFPYGH